jgi:tyrosyl-tRNA synthetase
MRASVAAGKLHPMQAKKDLAHSITADFHTAAEADTAAEGWATQFQQKGVAEDLEEVEIPLLDVESPQFPNVIRLASLLVKLGLAASNGEATRKLNEGAVSIDGIKQTGPGYHIANELLIGESPIKLAVRLGKRAKVATITMTQETAVLRRSEL